MNGNQSHIELTPRIDSITDLPVNEFRIEK